jgi:hypothetical protein
MASRLDLDAMATDALLERGIAAARVGENDEARACLTEVVSRDPDAADAWLWLAGVEPNPAGKRAHFERVLALRPDDPEAKAGLARLAEKYGKAVLQDEAQVDSLRCAWHPDRETGLTCTRCGRPMCPDCARKHPVGWRCKECAKELRSPLYKVEPAQAVVGFVVGLGLSVGVAALLGGLSAMLPWFGWIVGVVLAAPAGTLVADVVSRAGGKKRGRIMQWAAVAAIAGGVLVLFLLLQSGIAPRWIPTAPFGWGAFVVLGGAAAFAHLR